jgi:hypothetical protein
MSPNHIEVARTRITRHEVAMRASRPWFYRGMGFVAIGIAMAAFIRH